MNTIQRIARNTGALLAAQAGNYSLALVYTVLIARHLGPASFGILTFAIALTGLFGVLTDFGLRPLTVREVARDKSLASKYLANISLMKIVLVIVTFGLIALTVNLMGYPEQTIKVVYLMALFVIFGAFTRMFYSIFQAYERMEYESVGQVLHGVLLLSGVIIATKYGFGVFAFALLYCLTSVAVLMYSYAVLRWRISNPVAVWSLRRLEIDWSFWKLTIKQALPFGLSIVFTGIFFGVDSVMLSFLKGDAVVGWYNAAYRIVLALLVIPTTLSVALFPVMSKFHGSSPSSLGIAHEKFFKYMAILGAPIGVGTTLLARRLILLLFGTQYAESTAALQILVWSAVFIFLHAAYVVLFAASNRQGISAKITGVCLALNVVLNLILIPRYSLIGASIATLATNFLVLALLVVWSLRIGYGVPIRKFATIVIRVSVSSALMGVFIMGFNNLTLVALVPMAAVGYFFVLYLLRGIDKEDISFTKMVVLRK